MDTALIAALSALGGALIGSLSSFAGIYLAQRQETARALRKELFALLKKRDSQYHKLVQYRLDELSPKDS